MIRIRSIVAALAALAAVAIAAPLRAGPAEEARDVIERQLEAIHRDAWDEAFTFASPGIQEKFGTADRFADMVRSLYPMVWRPSSVDFLTSEMDGVYQVQRLELRDAAGKAYVARYYLRPIDGVWRIAAVVIEEAQLGA